MSQSEKSVSFAKICDEMHDFEERFMEARIKTADIPLWKRDLLQEVLENEVALR